MSNPVEEKPSKERGPRSKQKLKIMYLAKIFMENTDENHDITLDEIISKLDAYSVTAERKSLYNDIEQLKEFGMNIEKKQYDKTVHYKLVNRDFSLAELKLLVDSVQAAKFIDKDTSNDLIKKLENLSSKQNASQLQRQVFVAGRVKSLNKELLKNVDAIHNAIASNTKISFLYYQWTVNKELEVKKNGERYNISPWGLSWDDENYYLIGYDSEADKIKHYRVDKMQEINVEVHPREGRDKFDKIDMAEYSKKMFSMYDGKEQSVQLLCENELAGVMIDRFGTDIHMLKVDDTHFKVSVRVAVSKHFIAWVIALGKGVKIISPDYAVNLINEEIDRLIEQYK